MPAIIRAHPLCRVPGTRATFQLFTEAFDPPDKLTDGIPACLLCGAPRADHLQHLVHECLAPLAVSAREEFAEVVPLCAMPHALTLHPPPTLETLHRVATLCGKLMEARNELFRSGRDRTATTSKDAAV